MNFEIRPIRCFTCGSMINCYEDSYKSLVESGVSIEEALDTLGFKNPCCRSCMMIPVLYPYVTLDESKVYGVSKSTNDRQGTAKPATLAFETDATADISADIEGLPAMDNFAQKRPLLFSEPVIDMNHLTIRKNDGGSVSIPVAQRSKWTIVNNKTSITAN